jgi:CrcB protein
MIKQLLIVGIGGMVGSVLRYATGLLLKSTAFPWATFTVNLLGCFVMGIVLGTTLKNQQDGSQLQLLLATGFCGGFTTFSAFSAQGVQLLLEHRYTLFLLYFAASIVLGLLATWFGLLLTR